LPAASPPRRRPWWPWAAGAAALIAVFQAYAPALYGPFVLDDLYLRFATPGAAEPLSRWISNVRPLLMASYWLDYQRAGAEPYAYHVTNLFLHFLGSLVVTLVALRLLEFAGVAGTRRMTLGLFAGGLFLLHPLQTESVAYVASRSEVLSVLLYMSAFALFLYRPAEQRMTVARALPIVVLFAGAISTKEHALTLPALLALADWHWKRGGVRRNWMLYALLAVAGAGGAWLVWRVLKFADTAGFRVAGVSPVDYFFTQCRVVWTYVRLYFLPFGQNVDPDVALSRGPLDHGATFGLAALVALAAAAWFYRRRFPLAAFGVWMFLLLLAPTSSLVPIRDPLAERRLYLPFLGLTLVPLEFLRRRNPPQVIAAGAAVLALCGLLTHRRSAVWGDTLALWQDTVSKSPNKWRPRFQLAHAYYSLGRCPEAVGHYEAASRLGPLDVALLLDWGLALECAGRPWEGVARLRQAAEWESSAHVYSQIGMIYAKHRRTMEAHAALNQAERIDPRFEMTYVYRGNLHEAAGDRASAAHEYRRALAVNPSNQAARQALARVSP
jgi:tetratricopeptide (TPR) repeat protein